MDIFSGKPFLRGHFHQAAFFYALGASSLLISFARGFDAKIAAIVYGLCLCTLFGVSSLYHRIQWSQNRRQWLRRLDHAAIFVFISGTTTPICMLALNEETGRHLLKIFWGAALIGVLKEIFWVSAPKWVSAVFYVLMGWLAAPYLEHFFEGLGANSTWLLIIGGLIYTLGAVIYALKKPNPWPKVFGYHEIFHVLVVVASVFHFIVIYRIVV